MDLVFVLIPSHPFRLHAFGVLAMSGRTEVKQITFWFSVGTNTRHVCLAGGGIWCRALPVPLPLLPTPFEHPDSGWRKSHAIADDLDGAYLPTH